jgi:hypothetical protein
LQHDPTLIIGSLNYMLPGAGGPVFCQPSHYKPPSKPPAVCLNAAGGSQFILNKT